MRSKLENGILAAPVEINWHPALSIYASPSFLKTVSDEYGWIGGFDRSGALLCVLPFCVIRKFIFRLVRFPVQTIMVERELDISEEKAFLNRVVEHFKLRRVDLIIPATFNTVFRTCPDGAIAAPYSNQIIDLRQSEELLWKNLHPKHRNVIRNATKKGVTIRVGLENLETSYLLVRDSFRRSFRGLKGRIQSGFRMDYAAFKKQVFGFGEHVKVFVAELEGEPQGCAVIPFSRSSAYYMHGGSIDKPLTGASNLLQWEAIRLFRKLGTEYYDFFGSRVDPESGSKAEGITKFKERFGGNRIQGYMWKYPFDPLKCRLYSLVARLRSNGDVVDQERHKLNMLKGY